MFKYLYVYIYQGTMCVCVRPITYMNTNTCQVRKKWRRGKRKQTITKTAKSLEAQMVMWQYAGTAPVVWFVREHLPGRRSPRPHCHATRGRHLAASSSGNLPCFCCHLGPSVHKKKNLPEELPLERSSLLKYGLLRMSLSINSLVPK